MNTTLGSPDDLQTKVYKLCDACVHEFESEDERIELEQLIQSNSEARELYLDFFLDSAALRLLALSHLDSKSLDHTREPLIDLKLLRELEQQPEAFDASLPTVEEQRSLRVQPRVVRLLHGIGTRVVHSPISATIVVASLVYGVFGYLAWDLRPDKLPSKAADDLAVAMVRDATDVQWSAGTTPKVDDSPIRIGEPLKIESGQIQLHLKQGAELLVEGPAEWTIDGENSAILRSGKLIAKVSSHAIGFTLSTPTTQIVDLGTEFGVEVNPAGQTDVEVIAGKVAVRYNSAAKPEGLRQSVQLSAGAARRFSNRIDGNGVSVTPITPWVRQATAGKKFSGANSELPSETKYVAAVLADKPLGYWRFSDKGDRKAMDASGHGNHGEYVGFVSTKNPGICPSTSDQSVRFLGKEYAGYVRIKDVEFPASFSVELWARSAAPVWNIHGWLFSCRAPNGFVFSPSAPGRDWGVFMHNSRREGRLVGMHGPPNVVDRFHQYAFSYDVVADQGTMYFDGALVHEKANVFGDGSRREKARLTFYVGRDDPEEDPHDVVWGEGFVDELAIYEGTLSAAAIQRHFEAAGINQASLVEDHSPPATKE